MEKRDHTSIDTKDLADSLRRKFHLNPLSLEGCNPLSHECCIFRVPELNRRLSPSDFTPKMISIGPLHHGRKELQFMEEHKINYLRSFLGRTDVSMEDFLALIKNGEADLRNCYAETIPFKSDDFVRIILVDAVFLLEFYLRGSATCCTTDDDRIFGKPGLLQFLWFDFWLVENQLPFFILNELFNLAKTATNGNYYEGLSLETISRWYRENIFTEVPLGNNSLENHFSKASHLLDWLRLYIQPSDKSHNETIFIKRKNLPSLRELHQAGVKIQLQSSKNLLDINLNEGILKIPFLKVYESTECLFQNILTFEVMIGSTHYFNDYILLMSYLISTTKNAELLIEKEVIGQRNGEQLLTIFQNLNKNCVWYRNFQYSDDVRRMEGHCQRPCNKWKSILRQNYFHTWVHCYQNRDFNQ